MKTFVILTLFIGLVWTNPSHAAESADANWPQFRGPHAAGIGSNTNLPDKWSATENVSWKTELPGRSWSSPVVWGGRVFLTVVENTGVSEPPKKGLYFGGERPEVSKAEHRWKVLCLDLATGKAKWEKTVYQGPPQTPIHLKSSYGAETPVTDGERIYALFGNLGLFALSLEGQEVWSRRVEPRKMRNGWGSASSPLLHEGRLFLVNDNEDKSEMLALDAKTGKELWRADRDEKSNWTTPFLWENDKRTEIVTSGSRAVRSFDLDGKLLWSLSGMSSIAIPTPVAGDGLLFASSGYVGDKIRPVYAIRPGASGDITLKAGETNSEFIAWSNPTGGSYNPSPLFYDGRFYVLFDRGLLSCYDAKTGKTLYDRERLPDGFAFTASPWAAGGRIFCLNEDGACYVVRAGDKFELLHVNKLTGDDMCMATPALAGDRLLLRTATRLYCIRTGGTTESAVNIPVPTPQQVAWHEAGVGLFFHWAPNVYQGGEGDNRSTPLDRINPDRFDAGQWVRAVKAAGAGYMIFVAKHVGGYCAWQTKTTDYSLKTSPWKQGHGDMLAELSKACQAEAVRLGVYLCPRDDTQGAQDGGRTPAAENQAAYNSTYRQQLTEILTQYGPMFEMWFDGGNIVPINDLIDLHAPGIISFQGRRTGGSRWVGTEDGFAPYPCWNTIDWKPGETPKEGAGNPAGNTWCPAECDVSILRPAWFWSEGSDSRILSLDDLLEIYYLSVGRGVNLLLNATPDPHGEVPAAQMKRLQEFGDEIRERFAKPLFTCKGGGNILSLDFNGGKTIDHIVLREEIRGGERIRKFLVEGRNKDGKWLALASGSQVGVRQIIPIPPAAITSVRLIVQESAAPVTIAELSVFHVNRPVPERAFRE